MNKQIRLHIYPSPTGGVKKIQFDLDLSKPLHEITVLFLLNI